jgi:Transposase DDE domain/Transposase domain (DUF772)
MYRPTSTQSSLFEPDVMFPGVLPKDDWSYIFRDKIYSLIDEEKFKHLFKEKGGAPNKSIKLMISILIFMAIEKLTWREAEFQFLRRIDWMIATSTALGDAFIDFTTLFKFYQRLEQDDTAYQFFQELTSLFIIECGVSTKKQRVDSFFMLGWLKILSRYGLFKETIRAFLLALRKHKPGLYEEIKAELSRDYLEKEFDLTEKDKDKANRKISEMAKDLYVLIAAFENHHQLKHYEGFKTLKKVFEQQCSVTKEEASEPKIEIRKKPVGDKIISSPHNTDAEYTRKRKQTVVGHKAFVTETCDSDNEVQFITDANLETAKHADSKETLKIEERLEDNETKPEIFYGDAGFVNGKTILESAEKGIDLAGPSSGRSQSIENFEQEDRPLDTADFEVKINDNTKELEVLSCPNKQKPLDQRRSDKGHILVHFESETCSQCSMQDRCPVNIGAKISTLRISEEQYAGAARHQQYMEDSDYRQECGIRAGAESLVNEVANGHGARKSRHRTEKRSRLQLIFASIGCNVKRFIRYQVNCVQNQPEMAVSIA